MIRKIETYSVETLRAEKARIGCTIEQLAQASGLSFTLVAGICAGRLKNPTLSTLRALGKALGVVWMI